MEVLHKTMVLEAEVDQLALEVLDQGLQVEDQEEQEQRLQFQEHQHFMLEEVAAEDLVLVDHLVQEMLEQDTEDWVMEEMQVLLQEVEEVEQVKDILNHRIKDLEQQEMVEEE